MRRLRGLTITELLIAVAIIVIIAAVVFPIVRESKERAKLSACGSKMMQIFHAIELYRHNYDGDGKYDEPEIMGLPPTFNELIDDQKVPLETFVCLAPPNDEKSKHSVFTRMFLTKQQGGNWGDYCRKYLDDSILIVDKNHNPPSVNRESPVQKHWAEGVYLGGNLKAFYKFGDQGTSEWWNSD